MTMTLAIERQTDEQPVMFPGTEHVTEYFHTDDQRLPRFRGRTFAEHVAAWGLLSRKDKDMQWRRAALAASLQSQRGHRTDLEGGATSIQDFCTIARIGAGYFSRLGLTHRVFDELLATGSKKSLPALLEDDALCWKHFFIAANHAAMPVEALLEARELGWSANELERVLARRKGRTLLDANATVDLADDDDAPEILWHTRPERVEARQPSETRELKLLLTKREQRALARQLRDLSAVVQTASDHATLLAVVARAHAEWVELHGMRSAAA